MSNDWLDSEFEKDAAVPWKSACMLAGNSILSLTLLISFIAVPKAACGARLKDTVTAGNWPWWLIESASVVGVIVANVLSGTELLPAAAVLALAVPIAVAPARTLLGVVKSPEEGVYLTPPVRALEPAAADAEDENDVVAEAPVAFADAFVWM